MIDKLSENQEGEMTILCEQNGIEPMEMVGRILKDFYSTFTDMMRQLPAEVMALDPAFQRFEKNIIRGLSELDLALIEYQDLIFALEDRENERVVKCCQSLMREAYGFEKLIQEISKALSSYGIECPDSLLAFYQQEEKKSEELDKLIVGENAMIVGFEALLETPDFLISNDKRLEATRLIGVINHLEKSVKLLDILSRRAEDGNVAGIYKRSLDWAVTQTQRLFDPETKRAEFANILNETNKTKVDYLSAFSILSEQMINESVEISGPEAIKAYRQIAVGLSLYCAWQSKKAKARLKEIYDEIHTK
jgi:hypothetical protein